MGRLIFLLLSIIPLGAQAPADSAFYSVAYVDVMPSSKTMAIAAFKQYRDTSQKDQGFVRFDLFEQVLFNILDNAAKYTSTGGHVWVAVTQRGPSAQLRRALVEAAPRERARERVAVRVQAARGQADHGVTRGDPLACDERVEAHDPEGRGGEERAAVEDEDPRDPPEHGKHPSALTRDDRVEEGHRGQGQEECGAEEREHDNRREGRDELHRPA